MKKMKKNLKKNSKKALGLILVISLIATLFTNAVNVFANNGIDNNEIGNGVVGNNTKLVIQTPANGNNVISIDSEDTTKLVYKIDDTVVGYAKVKLGNDYVTPILNGGKAEFVLNEYTNDSYSVIVEVTPEVGYDRQPTYYYAGSSDSFPGDNRLQLDISSNNSHILDFMFETSGNSGTNNNEGPILMYPIVAYFEGISNGILTDESNSILIPENWTSGEVSFKAKVCKSGEVTVPNDGFTICDENSIEEVNLSIEGIINGEEINDTVRGNSNRTSVAINEAFGDYGKVLIHVVGNDNVMVDQFIRIASKDLINIKAISQLSLSQSFGTASLDQAIITKDEPKDVSIFFGNTETILQASGQNVEKITAVDGGTKVVINADGTATVSLPNLSIETTTKVVVTILLKDNTSIKRTVNIKRTAITLQHNNGGGDNTLYAGYVVNKGYLYNNKNHDDKVFDAYLQVILYKDDTVVGYKQIKINDKELINNLSNDESSSLELYSQNQISVYGKETDDLIEGVNGASVFLTNGPIDYDSDILPSVEYGIGAGVKISWEEE